MRRVIYVDDEIEVFVVDEEEVKKLVRRHGPEEAKKLLEEKGILVSIDKLRELGKVNPQ